MKINAKTAGLILPLFFVLGIGITSFTGYWQTESSKEPAKYSSGELSGEYNPGDIRGSYSLEDIENAFGIPVETLAGAFGLADAENKPAIQVKEFESLFGRIGDMEIGTDSMRLFVALYLGRPYTPEEDTALPQPAFDILKKEGVLNEEGIMALEKKVVSLDTDQGHTVEEYEESAAVDEEAIQEIKGKTTFSELLDWGLSKEQIEQALGGIPMGQRSISVRDYCMEQGIEFSSVKTSLQVLLDQ